MDTTGTSHDSSSTRPIYDTQPPLPGYPWGLQVLPYPLRHTFRWSPWTEWAGAYLELERITTRRSSR